MGQQEKTKIEETAQEHEIDIARKKAERKYNRGKPVAFDKVKDKKLRAKLQRQEEQIREASESAARAELLLQEEAGFLEAEGVEKTYNYRQDQLSKEVDINTSKKIFTLDLPDHGPYCIDYTRNGRHLLMGGKRGHLAAFDWQTGRLHFETHVNELIRDVKWLHNETLLATAQKQHVFIYDQSGLEIHRLKHHQDVNKLEFLPYHFLLASVGNAGYLKYQDTSTGQFVTELRTKLGSCHTMAQNPWNAIIHLGHVNGTVTLWSPNSSQPHVKMLCHKGPVQSLAVDPSGRYMATAGLDGKLKIWDIRKYEPLQEYYSPRPATSLSISQRGLLGVGWTSHVTIWKDAFRTKQQSPYMNHLQPSSTIRDIQFVPYEDVLGFGHAKGVSSIVVPGAGEPNFDTLEANPYQTVKQRQEAEVHGLLDKLQPEMIVLDPTQIGRVTRASKNEILKRRREEEIKNDAERFNQMKKKTKRHMLRQRNVVDPRKVQLQEDLQYQRAKMEKKKNAKPFTTLDIFE